MNNTVRQDVAYMPYLFQYHKFWRCCWKIYRNNSFLCLLKYSSTFLICNAIVLPCPGTDSIWEIFYESVLDNLKRYFHQTSHTALTVVFLQGLWHQIKLTLLMESSDSYNWSFVFSYPYFPYK